MSETTVFSSELKGTRIDATHNMGEMVTLNQGIFTQFGVEMANMLWNATNSAMVFDVTKAAQFEIVGSIEFRPVATKKTEAKETK
jgi:hypothetical protein